jgi:diacylglycerol kinase (ATP)
MSSDSNLPLVIVNPKSAGGSTESRWANIASDLATHFGPYNVEFTRAAGDGIRLAEEAANQGRKFIIACGGDGTINEIANGILRSGLDAELGVLPSGTGGDFRRTLGIPSTAGEAARGLKTGETRTIDVGKVTFLDHDNKEASRYFVGVSSFGLSVSIIERVKKQKALDWIPVDTLRGKAGFALSTLQEVLDLNYTTVRVRLDENDEYLLNTINFCVANARFFGGGMKIAPDAQLNDGLFDVVNIGDIKTAKILLNAWKLYGGSHLSLDEVKHTNAKRVEIKPSKDDEIVHLETDGELPGKLPAIYEMVPQALKVRVPKTEK